MANMAKATEIYDNLTTLKLVDGGERVIWKDSVSEELRTEFQELTSAHSDYNFLELDEYFVVLQMLVSYMQGYDEFNLDQIYECDWRDDSNADRLDWLKANLTRETYYDDVKDNGADSLFAIIGDMQDMHRHDIAYAIFTELLGGEDE